MKKTVIKSSTLALLLSLTLFFTACKKYEEGPCLSFRSPEKRIEGGWTINQYNIDNIEYLSLLKNYYGDIVNFEFAKEGSGEGQDFIFIFSLEHNNNLQGYFHFIDNFEKCTFQFIQIDTNYIDSLGPLNHNMTSTWDICKLSKKEFIIQTENEEKNYELILNR
jgi:hypothetical protein